MKKSETSVVKRRHKSSPSSSSPAREKLTVNFSPNFNRPSVKPRSLLRQSQKENSLPAELQIHDDLVVPFTKKSINSSIEVRQSFNSLL